MTPYFIFFVFVTITIPCTVSLLSHDEECLALYQFKQTILHQDFGSPFDSWKISSNASNCCLWDGVVCGNERDEGRVIGLDLSKSFLHGTIDSNTTLFSLVRLQTLNLAWNDFSESQIPSEIGRLKQLKSLILSGCGFSGEIPSEVGELIHLSTLDLSQNPLKLQSISLEKIVQNLTRLEQLHLSEVDISSSVPLSLANFSSLRLINLRSCRLQNQFPEAIFHLQKLKFIDVSSNTNLIVSFPEFQNNSLLEILYLDSTTFYGILPKSVSNLHHLKRMDLTHCSISGRIPGSLSNLTQLIELGIGYNNFTGLVPSLVSLTELNVLELSGNKFENGCLPDWIGKLNKLEQLFVYEMNLYGEIPPFFTNLTKLTYVGMGVNSLFGHIPSSIFNLTQLSSLYLGENQLQGPISSSFSNFKNLQDLDLQINNFSGSVDLDMFLGFKNLKSLLLGNNMISLVATSNYSTNDTLPELNYLDLSTCNLKEFPAFLRFQHEMENLLVFDNNIEGLVPLWSWNHSQETLQVIGLAENFITGFQYHPQFLPWVRLEVLDISSNNLQGRLPIPPQTTVIYDLSDNNLTGEIPPLICEAKSLQVLELSSNNMSGVLPSCFSNLTNSLLVLNLKGNKFEGTVMNAFMHGSQLKRIDLSENRFEGRLPKTLANYTSLEFLALGDNSFSDVFPSWLGVLPELQVLILRSNKFHGEIQVETNVSSQFPSLRIIDLSKNGFSGRLPHEYFQAWKAMKSVYIGKSFALESDLLVGSYVSTFLYSMSLTNKGVKTEYEKILNIFTAIDLSCNKFEGQIPQSFQDLQGLQSLNLSNNHLVGGVLPSFGKLKNLESLDLSHNELSGEIPQQLVQLGFLAVLNVSFNHLNGHIPQGKQFNTFENNSYIGNPGLCGMPLSKKCQNPEESLITPQPTSSKKSESIFPSETTDWIVIFSGVGSGLIIGLVIGNFVYSRYDDWFVERFKMRKDRWVRPLHL